MYYGKKSTTCTLHARPKILLIRSEKGANRVQVQCVQTTKGQISLCYLIRAFAVYRNYHKYSDRPGSAKSVDHDQTPQNAASDRGLHCLLLIQHFVDTP